MDDDVRFPGLVGAGISPARERLDSSFQPGEATTEDVRQGLLDILLSAFMGSPMMPKGEPVIAPGRVRKGFREQRFPHKLDVRVRVPSVAGGETLDWYDVVKGLNRGHAAQRARENWPGAEVELMPQLAIKGRMPR